MNSQTARKLLNITIYELNEDILKKKYYKACLKHHPDKKGDPQVFLKITEAYEFLKKEIENDIFMIYIRCIINALLYYFYRIQYELTPSLKQLMNRDIYVLKDYGLYIPLWHQELVFKNIYIEINPQLPDNIYIDEHNNIHVFEKGPFPIIVNVGDVSFSIQHTIKNIVELKGMGIPVINIKNIYDVSVLSDIIVHITSSY